MVLRATAAPETAPATATADTAVVVRGRMTVSVDLDGYFEPIEPAEIRIRPHTYQGELRIISAQSNGAGVKAGDVLLQIDATDLKLQLAEAENALQAARTALERAKADAELGVQADALWLKMTEDRVATAEGNLKWFDDVDGKEMLQNAELSVRRARASVEDQSDELDQLKKMYKTEELTSATADIVVKRAVRSLELSRVAQQLAEARQTRVRDFDFPVARQRLVYALEQETQALAQARSSAPSRAAQRVTAVEAARIALEKAEQKHSQLQQDLDMLTVRAPFDGVLYHGQLQAGNWQNASPKQLRPGEKLPAGQVAMTLVSPGKFRLAVDLPESKVNWIARGAPVRVIPVASGKPLAGKVLEIAPVSSVKDNNAVYATKIELAAAEMDVRPGARASARIDAGIVEGALLVPVSAVSKGRVKVRGGDGKDAWRDVVIGRSDGVNIEVLDGLSEGDTVVQRPTE